MPTRKNWGEDVPPRVPTKQEEKYVCLEAVRLTMIKATSDASDQVGIACLACRTKTRKRSMPKMEDENKVFEGTDGQPRYNRGAAASLVGTAAQTLRNYEKYGFLSPARDRKSRLYSGNDITWLRCLRELIHTRKYSVKAVKKLLEYAPCWELSNCPEERRANCKGFGYMGRQRILPAPQEAELEAIESCV